MTKAFKLRICNLIPKLLAHTFIVLYTGNSARAIAILFGQTILNRLYHLGIRVKPDFHMDHRLFTFLYPSIIIGRIIGRRRVRSKIKRPKASRIADFRAAHSVIPSSSQWQRASSTRIFTSSISSSDSRT